MRADSQNELIQLRERVVTLEAALLAAQQENALLRQKVDALVRRVRQRNNKEACKAPCRKQAS